MEDEMIKENDDFKLIYDVEMERFAIDLFMEINSEKKQILDFFKLENIRKVEILLFNSKEKFIDSISCYYSNIESIPVYCKANVCDGKIHILFDEKIESNEYRYTLKLRNVIHEYIHIIYNEYISPNYRILWLDEGIAINVSKERAYLKNKERFTDFLMDIRPTLNKIRITEFEHGSKFVNDEYNGYDISYLLVRYLIENFSNDEINILIRDNDQVHKLEENIMNDVISYFYGK